MRAEDMTGKAYALLKRITNNGPQKSFGAEERDFLVSNGLATMAEDGVKLIATDAGMNVPRFMRSHP